MTRLAEFKLAADDFPLGRLFDERPEATLELDRVVPSGDTVWPYFWVRDPGADMADVLSTFEEVTELRSIRLMDDLGDRGLFRAEWEPAYIGIMGAIAEAGVTVVAATGSADGWVFELRATDGDQLRVFREYCTRHDIDVELTRLSRLTESDDAGLTPAQREALTAAYESGYYDEPRGTDQTALAERLGVSRQALAGRLRRGHRGLVEATLLGDENGD
jgi:predicted DNA binding protein